MSVAISSLASFSSLDNPRSLESSVLHPASQQSDVHPLTLERDEKNLGKPDLSLVRTQSNQVNEPNVADYVPYSRFGTKSKMGLVMQCAFTGFFSTIAASIYFPVLGVVQRKFHISEEQVNMTVVVYYIFQALSPTLMGGLADSLGRRPVVLSSVIIYFCACVGLARCNTYAQIIALRCVQAAGISPVIAINSGMMGDVTTKAERGGYVGYVSGFQVVGTATGAVFGALLSSRWGWRSIFWFLAIGSGACSIVSLLLLPETKRTIVGNGSVTPKSIYNYSPILRLPPVRKQLHLDDPDYQTLEPHVKVSLLAPLGVLKIPEIALLLFVSGVQFATWTTHQTALTNALGNKYHMKVIDIGVCFLPSGICTMASVILSGRYLNWTYRRRMANHKAWLKTQEEQLLVEHQDLSKVREIMLNDSYYVFNIYRARLEPALITLLLSSAGFISFGWCISVKAPLPAVLVMSGFSSLFSNSILTMSMTLIVDLFPARASTATGCLNLVRCALSAIFIACLSRMARKMKFGGLFTFLGCLTACSSCLLLILVKNGKRLTFERRRSDEKHAAKQAAAKNDSKV
ncbi:MFS transporter KNAG_0E01170 [Huiozyma naganishii CBS 8797]|uniref:Major facilitator superfamily (MFS) profile domain-containing protein n=1 Tax=Huiozyma naganishii (strain ATCC MYA-139 / BCRC 22969 / CBS 8797 / KCTC 17520 / NBRC 10181 / NCYC 3082 / Yp74L-3) TaxID=1071383 RepID=J7S6H3_HUIN7|nr:hypothetical protein KNAG_0E01170 [Kazachstania naganishii CBS 8797]CCK70384.1 hypothetical protein KNAG_0E01170 [Kazachstania naganishii CBS 8797]